MAHGIGIGVLALQGAFYEHIQLLQTASSARGLADVSWSFFEVRTPEELAKCDALVIPGGESTTMALVAERSGLLDPLREFVKIKRKPTWGTCAGLILLSESANRTKRGGQELIGGLDVRVNRNHFGRQTESFETDLQLPFIAPDGNIDGNTPFRTIFIRAPVVEKILPAIQGEHVEEAKRDDTVIAPSMTAADGSGSKASNQPVEVLAALPGRRHRLAELKVEAKPSEEGDIVAVRQGNVFGCSFHPELTSDARIHSWWLYEVRNTLRETTVRIPA